MELPTSCAPPCNDSVVVQTIDIDLDTDPGVTETVIVLVTSTTEPAGEWVTLTETTTQSSRFEGAVPLSGGPVIPGDGLVAVAAGDLISASYADADDGQGSTYVAVDTATADCAPPAIGNVRVTEIAATRAVVEWETDEPATSKVEFGASPALGSVIEDNTLVTAHRVVSPPSWPATASTSASPARIFMAIPARRTPAEHRSR